MAFIARDRPQPALEWLERLLEAGDSLAELPERGRVVPEAARADIRELVVGPYRIIYRCDPDVVTITMIRHVRRYTDEEDVV